MLRQAVFVLVLAGAAFAGGAAINGPGLAWLQRNLIGGPTVVVDGPHAPAAARFPTASPPLPSDIPTTPDSAATAAPGPLAALDAPPSGPASPAPGLPESTSPAPTAPGARPGIAAADLPPLELPGDPAVGAVASSTPAPNPAVEPAAALPDPGARRASAGGLDPSPLTGSGRDWAEVRQRLKALGVARYSVEADLDGRVRFSCVIPVDGLRAVGHHFEADGDDEFQAVEATLRRVALWRATEPGRADP